MRRLTLHRVMALIMHDGPISRAQIAKRAGISKQTVSDAVRELETAGWIREAGRTRGRVGRTAVNYTVEPEAGYVVGLDQGGPLLRVAIADLACRIVAEEETAADGDTAAVPRIESFCRAVAGRHDIPWDRVQLSVLGWPGSVAPAAVALAPERPTFDTGSVRGRLELALGGPVMIEGDVNLAALGEQWRGHGQGIQDLAFVAVGTRVGLGILLDGQLRRGASGAAGAIAPLPIGGDPFEPAPSGGGALALGQAVGARGIERRYEAAGGEAALAAGAILARAEAGDATARRVVEQTAACLARGLAAIAAVLDPELLVLGGGIGSRPGFAAAVETQLELLALRVAPLRRSALGDRATTVGALALGLRSVHQAILGPVHAPAAITLPGAPVPRWKGGRA